jgi:hypothetical protein
MGPEGARPICCCGCGREIPARQLTLNPRSRCGRRSEYFSPACRVKAHRARMKSRGAMYGAKRGAQRIENDAYYTDPADAAILAAAVADVIRVSRVVVESSVGGGTWFDACAPFLPPDVVRYAVDLDPRARGLQRPDVIPHVGSFLDWAPCEPVDLVIGNPPYTLADEFVRHSHRLLMPGGSVVFLLRFAYPQGRKRIGFLREFPIKRPWCLAWRTEHVRPDGRRIGKNRNPYAMGLFWWRKGDTDPLPLAFLDKP